MISSLITYGRLLEPEHYAMRDMTPAQIARSYGPTVADYVVELREECDIWRQIAVERAAEHHSAHPLRETAFPPGKSIR